jgi:hypothetical protein
MDSPMFADFQFVLKCSMLYNVKTNEEEGFWLFDKQSELASFFKGHSTRHAFVRCFITPLIPPDHIFLLDETGRPKNISNGVFKLLSLLTETLKDGNTMYLGVYELKSFNEPSPFQNGCDSTLNKKKRNLDNLPL